MIFDLGVAIIILISAGISFLRGLIRELFTIAGVAGGIIAALFFAPSLAPIFRGWFGVVEGEDPSKLFEIIPMNYVADGLAYLAIFIAFVIIISVFSQFLAGAVKAAGLGPIDRTLGVVFGIARAALLLALLYLPFHLLMDAAAKEKYFSDSKTHLYVEKSASFIAQFLPSSKEVEDKLEEVKDTQIKKKLFENEILRDGNQKPAAQTTPADSEKPEKSEGYEQEERQKMKRLFQQPTYNE